MAMNGNVLKNLGKSLAYTAVDVTNDYMPNTTDFIRTARSGVDEARNYARTNMSRIKTATGNLNKTTVARQARVFLEDTLKDIREGNFALGDIHNSLDKDLADIEAQLGEWDESFGATAGAIGSANADVEGSGSIGEFPTQSSHAVDLTQLELSAKGAIATVDAIDQLQSTLGNAQVATSQYMTERITQSLFTQMAQQAQHLTFIQRQLQTINENLVSINEFNRDVMATSVQTQLAFFDSVTDYMKLQTARASKATELTTPKEQNVVQRFMGDRYVDAEKYAQIVKENLRTSELGYTMQNLTGGIDSLMSLLKGGNAGNMKIQPQKLLMKAALSAILPKSARTQLSQTDDLAGTIFKYGLEKMGSYRYKMTEHPILGALGSIFGIDNRSMRTVKMGDFKKGEMTWNGEAQKVLTTVIPKELAEIKAAILGKEAEYFDMQTGRYMTGTEVQSRTATRFQDAIESPFANIFNKISFDPNDIADKAIWMAMDDKTKAELSKRISDAVLHPEKDTSKARTEMDTIFRAAAKALDQDRLRENGLEREVSDADVSRMMTELLQGVQTARARTSDIIQQLQEETAAFGQVMANSEYVNQFGNISFSKLTDDYLKNQGVNLKQATDATGGIYSQSGRRFDMMDEGLASRLQEQDAVVKAMVQRVMQATAPGEDGKMGIGKRLVRQALTGGQWKHDTRAGNAINNVMDQMYKLFMLDQGGEISGGRNLAGLIGAGRDAARSGMDTISKKLFGPNGLIPRKGAEEELPVEEAPIEESGPSPIDRLIDSLQNELSGSSGEVSEEVIQSQETQAEETRQTFTGGFMGLNDTITQSNIFLKSIDNGVKRIIELMGPGITGISSTPTPPAPPPPPVSPVPQIISGGYNGPHNLKTILPKPEPAPAPIITPPPAPVLALPPHVEKLIPPAAPTPAPELPPAPTGAVDEEIAPPPAPPLEEVEEGIAEAPVRPNVVTRVRDTLTEHGVNVDDLQAGAELAKEEATRRIGGVVGSIQDTVSSIHSVDDAKAAAQLAGEQIVNKASGVVENIQDALSEHGINSLDDVRAGVNLAAEDAANRIGGVVKDIQDKFKAAPATTSMDGVTPESEPGDTGASTSISQGKEPASVDAPIFEEQSSTDEIADTGKKQLNLFQYWFDPEEGVFSKFFNADKRKKTMDFIMSTPVGGLITSIKEGFTDLLKNDQYDEEGNLISQSALGQVKNFFGNLLGQGKAALLGDGEITEETAKDAENFGQLKNEYTALQKMLRRQDLADGETAQFDQREIAAAGFTKKFVQERQDEIRNQLRDIDDKRFYHSWENFSDEELTNLQKHLQGNRDILSEKVNNGVFTMEESDKLDLINKRLELIDKMMKEMPEKLSEEEQAALDKQNEELMAQMKQAINVEDLTKQGIGIDDYRSLNPDSDSFKDYQDMAKAFRQAHPEAFKEGLESDQREGLLARKKELEARMAAVRKYNIQQKFGTGSFNDRVDHIVNNLTGGPVDQIRASGGDVTDKILTELNEKYNAMPTKGKYADPELRKELEEKMHRLSIARGFAKQIDEGGSKDTILEEERSKMEALKADYDKYKDDESKAAEFKATKKKMRAQRERIGIATNMDDNGMLEEYRDRYKEALDEQIELIRGKGSAQKQKIAVMGDFAKYAKQKFPKFMAGGIISALGLGAVRGLAGGNLGLIASSFMPGNIIGAAIAGTAFSFLNRNGTVMDAIFGKKDDDGKRTGGLISKEFQTKAKKALPTIIGGSAAGIGVGAILGKVFGALPIPGSGILGKVGAVAGQFLPGGAVGAAILGSAAAFALKNEQVQDILFGKMDKETGERKGAFLSKAYNKITGKMKTSDGKDKKSLGEKIKKGFGAAGTGFATGMMMKNMGLLGTLMGPHGAIGMAALGAALSITGAGQKFADFLLGKKGKDGDYDGNGLLSRIGRLINVNLIEPATDYFKSTAVDFAWWLKEKVEIPFRMAFGPLIDAAKDTGKSVKERVLGFLDKTFKRVNNWLFQPIKEIVLKPIAGVTTKLMGGAIRGGLNLTASAIGAPFKLLSMVTAPKRWKEEKKFSKSLRGRENQKEIWESYKAKRTQEAKEEGEKYGKMSQMADRTNLFMAQLPVLGQLFRNTNVVADGAGDRYEEKYGKNALGWISARRDLKEYKKQYKEHRKEVKAERKQKALRREFINKDKGDERKVMDDINGWSNKEFTDRKKRLAKEGIHIKNRRDMQNYLYHYEDWKETKANLERQKQDQEKMKYLQEQVRNGEATTKQKKELKKLQSGVDEERSDLEKKDAAGKLSPDEKKRLKALKKQKNAEVKDLQARVKDGTATKEDQRRLKKLQEGDGTQQDAIKNLQRSQTEEHKETMGAMERVMNALGGIKDALFGIKSDTEATATATGRTADVDEATLDLQTGAHFDSDDESKDLSETMDASTAQQIRTTQAGEAAAAQAGAIRKVIKDVQAQEDRDATTAQVRSNGSGGDFDDLLGDDYDIDDDEETGSGGGGGDDGDDGGGSTFWDTMLANGISGVLKTLAGPAIVALVGTLLANEDVRNMLATAVGNVFDKAAELAGKAVNWIVTEGPGWVADKAGKIIDGTKDAVLETFGIKDEDGDRTYIDADGNERIQSNPEAIHGLGSMIFNGGAFKFAKDAGSRVLKTLGDGVKNKMDGKKFGMTRSIFSNAKEVATNAFTKAKTGITNFGKTVSEDINGIAERFTGKRLWGKAADAADAATDAAGAAAKGAAGAGGVAGKIVDAVDDADDYLDIVSNYGGAGASAATKAADAATDAATAGAKAAGGQAGKIASEVLDTAADVDAEDTAKALNWLEKAFQSAAKSKVGKAFKKVGELCKKITDFFANIKAKVAQKVFGNLADKLSKALLECGVKSASNLTPMAILNAVIAVGAAVDGAMYPERLFDINKDQVDGTMRTISAIFSAVLSLSGGAALVQVVSEITDSIFGYNFIRELAKTMYIFIKTASGDDEAAKRIKEAEDAFAQEVANYNEANGTNISAAAYSDMKNKKWYEKAADSVVGFFTGKKQQDLSQYEVGNYKGPSTDTSSEGNGAGYGEGDEVQVGTFPDGKPFTVSKKLSGFGPALQTDPRWADMPIGKFPNDQVATMGAAGCGPTALANAAKMAGYGNVDPVDVAQYAMDTGNIVDGGASKDLFTEGAKDLGIKAKQIQGSGIESALKKGNQVIASGEGYGEADPYTESGHVVSISGLNPDGSVNVQNPLKGDQNFSLKNIIGGLKNAWEVEQNKSTLDKLKDGTKLMAGIANPIAGATMLAKSDAGQNLLKKASSFLTGKKKVGTFAPDIEGQSIDDLKAKLGKSITGKVDVSASIKGEVDNTKLKTLKNAFMIIAKAIDASVGKLLGKEAGAKSAVTAVDNLFKTFIDPCMKKMTGEDIEKLVAAMAKAGAVTAAYMTPIGLVNMAFSAFSAVNGAMHPEEIFKVDPQNVDAKMRIIASIIQGALTATGMDGVIAVVSEVVAKGTNTDLIQQIAVALYKSLASPEESASLQDAINTVTKDVSAAQVEMGNDYNIAKTQQKNQGLFSKITSGLKKLVGHGTAEANTYDVSKGRLEVNTKSLLTKIPRNGAAQAAGYGHALGYGSGATQNDPKWAKKVIGTFPSGKAATMESAGCGPTALSNAANRLGVTTNPAKMADFAMNNGFISEGGANDGLFDQGASKFGLSTTRVQDPDSITNNLKRGRPVILAGKGNDNGPYTQAGHIITATGIDKSGNVTVEDPRYGSAKKYPLKTLQSKMTSGWAVGRGSVEEEDLEYSDNTASGYGIFDTILSAPMSKLTTSILEHATAASGLDLTRASTGSTTDSDGGGGGGTSADENTNRDPDRPYNSGTTVSTDGKLGAVSAQFESNGDPGTVSSGKGDAGGVSFGMYQFPSYGKAKADSDTPLARFWNDYGYASKHPGVDPGNNQAFKDAWVAEAKKDPEGFAEAQHKMIANDYYAVARNKLIKDIGFDPDKHSRVAQELVWSTAVQFGPITGAKVIKNALKNRDPATMSATDFVNVVSDWKRDGVDSNFKSSSKSVRDGVRKRFDKTERNALLQMVDQNPIGYGGHKPPARGYGIFDTILSGPMSILTNRILQEAGAEAHLDLSGSSTSADDTDNGGGTTNNNGSSGGAVPTGAQGNYTGGNGINMNVEWMKDSNGVEYPVMSYDKSVLPGQAAVVNAMASKYHQVEYSTSKPQNVAKNVGSCASTVAYGYEKGVGKGGMSASSQAQSQDKDFTTIWTNPGQPVDESILQPGDALYIGWKHTKYTSLSNIGHTEMYAGGGKTLNHGGDPKYGPELKNLPYRAKNVMVVRRYTPFIEEQEKQAKAGGSINTNNTQTQSAYGPAIGYGAGEGDPDFKHYDPTGYGSATPDKNPELLRAVMGIDRGNPDTQKKGDFKVVRDGKSYFQKFDDGSKATTPVGYGFADIEPDGEMPEEESSALSLNTAGQFDGSDGDTMSGYGPGAGTSSTEKIETRMDRMITILETIANNGKEQLKAKPHEPTGTVNINYGEGDKKETKVQPIVLNNQQQQSGGKDMKFNYLRKLHKGIASADAYD